MKNDYEIKKLFEADYAPLLIPILAEIICEEVPDRIRELHFSAYRELWAHLKYYEKRGYCPKLLCGIAEKKGKMLLQITSKTEMKKLMEPHIPHYNGAEFIPDAYDVPEEELICWSEASLNAPLNSAGHKRYMQVFGEVFPEESKEILES